jgi:hypothetical protein
MRSQLDVCPFGVFDQSTPVSSENLLLIDLLRDGVTDLRNAEYLDRHTASVGDRQSLWIV